MRWASISHGLFDYGSVGSCLEQRKTLLMKSGLRTKGITNRKKYPGAKNMRRDTVKFLQVIGKKK
jgi:hypothetical protein